jgi:hypothetical protein
MVPFSHRNAWAWPLAVVDAPTIWPASLIDHARLVKPPRVPRFRMTPFDQRKARVPCGTE